jgi:Flp pilus assembly protein TadG
VTMRRIAQVDRVSGPKGDGRPRRSQRGSALVEVTWLSILLLMPLLYVMLAVFDVQRASFAATSAARQAARAYVLSPSDASAPARAGAAAELGLADHDLDKERATVTTTCAPSIHHCLTPGSVVTVEVTYQVDLPLMPSALGGNTPSIRVQAAHRVPYGTFREDRS